MIFLMAKLNSYLKTDTKTDDRDGDKLWQPALTDQ